MSASRPLLLALALLVGLGGGFAAALLLQGGDGATAPAPIASAAATAPADPDASVELPPPDPLSDPAAATDPEQALRGFLAAEAAGEWERSYDFLTAALREDAYPTAAAWIRAHADFPTVTAYRIDQVALEGDDDRARITTLTGFDPVVDPVLGLVAARGRTTWVLERTADGLWRVDAASTANQPLYPGTDGLTEVAQQWVDRRVACQDTSGLEAGLIGTRSLAESLCEQDQPDRVAVGQIVRLTDSGRTAPLVSQFGPEVFTWARAVDVLAATPLTLVLGPVGQDWRVVAVLPAG